MAPCSACTWLLRTQYREHGVPLRPEILHTSELLAPFASSLPVVEEKRLPAATYLDPCHLGRRLGCYEPPRQLLRRAVVTLHELPTHHGAPEARCCGAGGLLPTTEPELAAEMARERVADQPPATGPLISGCPACAHHVDKSGGGLAKGLARGLFEILDLATTP
jgi:heterodisulfide reductase subunit D